jgi:hypothetical protein
VTAPFAGKRESSPGRSAPVDTESRIVSARRDLRYARIAGGAAMDADVRILMFAVASLMFAQAHVEPGAWSIVYGVLGLCFVGRALLAARAARDPR